MATSRETRLGRGAPVDSLAYGRPHSPSRYLWTSGWALLPLRLFLGVTFLYAGLQKLADPSFFDAGADGSIQAQLHAATRTSPIGDLLGGLAHEAVAVGVVIALAEVAIGIGAVLGLWTRVAAASGVALSLGFLLTVSWHSHPYYLGPDIVFAAAWVPLALTGAGDDPRLSLDAFLRRRATVEMALPPAEAVPVPFATVQRLCGGYETGRCRYQRHRTCSPDGCPVLTLPAVPDPASAETLDRRTLLSRARAAGVLVLGGALASAATAGIGRMLGENGGGDPVASLSPTGGGSAAGSGGAGGAGGAGGSTSTTGLGTTTAAPATSGVRIGPASAVGVGDVASFRDPGSGSLAYVVQPTAGDFKAFSSVCPHAGCQVGYSRSADEFVCPCHGARFDGTGSVMRGPASRSLAPIPVTEGGDGQLYVDG